MLVRLVLRLDFCVNFGIMVLMAISMLVFMSIFALVSAWTLVMILSLRLDNVIVQHMDICVLAGLGNGIDIEIDAGIAIDD